MPLIVKITGDGNCFFRAISYALYGSESYHLKIRERVVNHIVNHWTDYRDFIVGDDSYGRSVTDAEEYGMMMMEDGQYGGMQEALAASQVFNVHFVIYDAENTADPPRRIGSSTFSRELTLLFSGNLDSGHFDVIQRNISRN